MLQSKSFQYQTEVPILDERHGSITVNVVGYRISNDLVELIFKDAMQSYIIPVHVVSSFVGSIYDIPQPLIVTGGTVGSTVGSTLNEDGGWTLVPTFCVVTHLLAICPWSNLIYCGPI